MSEYINWLKDKFYMYHVISNINDNNCDISDGHIIILSNIDKDDARLIVKNNNLRISFILGLAKELLVVDKKRFWNVYDKFEKNI